MTLCIVPHMESGEESQPLRSRAERLTGNKGCLCRFLNCHKMGLWRMILKMLLDFLLLAIVGLCLLFLLLWGEPFHRGYFEFDSSIRLPFKEESISPGLLAGVSFAIIVVTVIITEVLRDKFGPGTEERSFGDCQVPGWIWESYVNIGIYTFGAACQHLLVNVAKYSLGRLRPHFYDVCQPIVLDSDPNLLGFVTNYTCSGPLAEDYVTEARLSFPSAHSSFAMYTAVFFIFYMQEKGKWRGSKLLRHLLQFVVLVGAWYTGLSRVVEHKHHWSDVAGGFFIGGIFAVLTFMYVVKPKKKNELPNFLQDVHMSDNTLPRAALR